MVEPCYQEVLLVTTSRHPYAGEPRFIKARDYKPKDGSEPGPRIRVTYGEMPEIHRMLGAGWARHLPIELAAMYLVVSTQSHSKITGDLMWFNIKDLYPKTLREGFPNFPEHKKVEVANRFREEYGKPYKTTVKGLIKVLIELGLVERYWDGRGEGLRIPEVLPSPADKLNLSGAELEILAWRKEFTHTRCSWADPELQARGYF
jgi:hypothetical protein